MVDEEQRRQIIAHLVVAGGALLLARLLPGKTGTIKTLALMAAAEYLHSRFDEPVQAKLAELGI